LSKILALYTNEMIKLSRKLSVWMLVILMAISCLFVPAMGNKLFNGNELYNPHADETKAQITKTRDALREVLGDPNQYVQHTTLRFNKGNEVSELFGTYIDLEDGDLINQYSYLTCYNTVLDTYNFDAHPLDNNYLAVSAFELYSDMNRSLCFLNTTPFAERDAEWFSEYNNTMEALSLAGSALFNHDMSSMVALASMDIMRTSGLLSVSTWQRMKEVDPNGTFSFSEGSLVADALEECETYRHYLDIGAEPNQDGYLPLSKARRQQLEDSILILEYQISHGTLPDYEAERCVSCRQFTNGIARFFLILLTILIAGSSISQELATGSIKSLIIAPVKRWKIFLAKLLSIITWALAGSILITLMTTLSCMLFLGSPALPPYYYVAGGTVKTIPHFLFSLLMFLADNISLFVYILTAFMISCLTKNTGISVGVSAGLLLGGNLIYSLFTLFGHRMWIDFLPFSNMDLSGHIFPHLELIGFADASEAGLFGFSANSAIPLSFSVTYLVVLCLLLLLIAYDGFVRKDIQ